MGHNKTNLIEINVKPDGKRGIAGGAYCHYFMYTKYKGNFLIKGYWREIEAHIKENNYAPYFVNRVLFNNGEQRSGWMTSNPNVGIWEPCKKKHKVRNYWKHWQSKYEIRTYSVKNPIFLKRMPRKWIPEFDFIEYYH